MLKTEKFTGWGERLANPRNFQRIREGSPKVLVIIVGTLNITVLSVNIRNIGVMHGKVGHLKKVCRSKESKDARYIDTASNCGEIHDSLGFFTIREHDAQAAIVTMTVEGKELVLEVDTGASVTVIPNKLFKEKLGHLKLKPSSTSLKTYTGTVLPLCGEIEVRVEYQGQSAKLPLIVAEVDGKPAILGHNWLSVVKLNSKELFKSECQ